MPLQRWFSNLFGPAVDASRLPLAGNVSFMVVGLGNPGEEYDGTRHNIGFAVADRVAERLGASWAPAGGAGLAAAGDHHGRLVAVIKPQTFMNRSGSAVVNALDQAGLDPRGHSMLVVTDDLALPLGTIRMRPKGGPGSHNGLADVADALGHTDWPRLRIGVGSDFQPGAQVDHVLGPFLPEERAVIDAVTDRAADAALASAFGDIAAAMSRFNGRVSSD